jgi:ATP/ADP translocase
MGFTLTFWKQIVHLVTGAESDMSITFIMPISALAAYISGVVVSRFTPERKADTP